MESTLPNHVLSTEDGGRPTLMKCNWTSEHLGARGRCWNGKEKQAGTKALSFLKETPESKKKMKKQLHDSEGN